MPDGALHVLTCEDCGAHDPGGRSRCAACGGALAPQRVDGGGTLLTWTRVRRPPAGFDAAGPYSVALVELDEGLRITARLVNDDPEPPLGARLRLEDGEGGLPLAVAAPSDQDGAA